MSLYPGSARALIPKEALLNRFRVTILLAALTGVLAIAAPSQAALPKLTGTVGPGFTITLKKLGKKVITVKAGTYSITVFDKSNIHNFHLRGPKVNKQITTIAFKGVKTVIVKFSKGKYTFVCDPHFTTMKGSFTVT
jgi:plastocyanin